MVAFNVDLAHIPHRKGEVVGCHRAYNTGNIVESIKPRRSSYYHRSRRCVKVSTSQKSGIGVLFGLTSLCDTHFHLEGQVP